MAAGGVEDLIGQAAGGAFGGTLLLTFIIGLLRRWWVIGWSYDDLKQERDQWREIALSNVQLSGKAISFVERTQAGRAGETSA